MPCVSGAGRGALSPVGVGAFVGTGWGARGTVLWSVTFGAAGVSSGVYAKAGPVVVSEMIGVAPEGANVESGEGGDVGAGVGTKLRRDVAVRPLRGSVGLVRFGTSDPCLSERAASSTAKTMKPARKPAAMPRTFFHMFTPTTGKSLLHEGRVNTGRPPSGQQANAGKRECKMFMNSAVMVSSALARGRLRSVRWAAPKPKPCARIPRCATSTVFLSLQEGLYKSKSTCHGSTMSGEGCELTPSSARPPSAARRTAAARPAAAAARHPAAAATRRPGSPPPPAGTRCGRTP